MQSITDTNISEYELPVPDPPEPQSPKQRLRLSVPYLETAVTMGEGAKDGQLYEDDQTAIFHFPGFGVTTLGDVHIEARGPRKTSRVKIQTHGDLSIHSNDSCVNIGAYRGVTIGTDAMSTMVGASGAMIVGGGFGRVGGIDTIKCGLQDPERGEHPKTPEWVKSVNTLGSNVGNLLNALSLSMNLRHNAAEKQKEEDELKDISIEKHSKPAKYAGKLGLAVDAVGMAKSVYGIFEPKSDEPPEPSLLDLVTAGATIIGQAGMALASPNTISMMGGLGVGLFSPVSVAIDSGKLISVSSHKAVSILAGDSMEAHAKRNMTIAGGIVTQIGSNDLLTMSAQNHAFLKSKDKLTLFADKELTFFSGGDSAVETGTHHFAARDVAIFDGKQGAAFKSSSGNVSLISDSGFVDVGGSSAVNVHSGDALVKVEAGEISLTVDGDPAEPDMDPRDYYKPAIEDIKKRWSEAKQTEDQDEINKLIDDVKDLRATLASAISDYEGKSDGLSANTDNGIKITSSDITLSVGGDELKLSSGKAEILKSLKVT